METLKEIMRNKEETCLLSAGLNLPSGHLRQPWEMCMVGSIAVELLTLEAFILDSAELCVTMYNKHGPIQICTFIGKY